MSELFQNVICVFNKYTKMPNWTGGLPPTASVAWAKTKINNVMWKDNVHTNSSSDGKSFIDKTVSITIPLDEMETDKKYVKPEDFPALAETGVWSLQIGDIIVFGECDKEITTGYTITQLQKDYKTMEIRAVSDSTDQDILGMWKIDGV